MGTPDKLTTVEGRFGTPTGEYRNSSGLTSDQCSAAILEAHGFTSVEISKYLGVTKQAVSQWRHRAEYQMEVERAREGAALHLGGQLGDLRQAVVDGAEEAVRVLREGLGACDSTGDPRWTVRLKAAEALLGGAVRLVQAEARLAAAKPGDGAGEADQGQTSVILVHDDVVRAALGLREGETVVDAEVVVDPRSLIPREYGGEAE